MHHAQIFDLYYQDQQLDEERTISEYSIPGSGAVLNMYLSRAWVEPLLAKPLRVEVDLRQTVLNLKEMVQEKTHISIVVQNMYFNGEELKDNLELNQYRLSPEATIYVVLPSISATQINIALRLPEMYSTNTRLPTEIDRMSDHLMSALFISQTDRTATLTSTSYCEQIQDNRPSKSYRDSPEPEESIEIIVSTNTGKRFTLTVNPRNNIRSVKEKLEEVSGIKVRQQQLLFNKQELIDRRLVSECGIQQGSGLHLIIRAAGGCSANLVLTFNKLDAMVKIPYTDGPKWRRVERGISFWSKCQTRSCAAFQDSIIVNKGFGYFDIGRTRFELKCPICQQSSEVSTRCGFDSAKWTVEGVVLESGEKKVIPGETTSNDYHTFKGGDNRNWGYLAITVERKEA